MKKHLSLSLSRRRIRFSGVYIKIRRVRIIRTKKKKGMRGWNNGDNPLPVLSLSRDYRISDLFIDPVIHYT